LLDFTLELQDLLFKHPSFSLFIHNVYKGNKKHHLNNVLLCPSTFFFESFIRYQTYQIFSIQWILLFPKKIIKKKDFSSLLYN